MSRYLAGLRAKSAGDSFEALFKASCYREGIVCVDFPDGCTKQNTPYGLKLRQAPMPFDFMICRAGKAAAIDTKTTGENRFQFSCIIPHQLQALSEVGGQIPAGYVVWFRTIDVIAFFDHLKLQSLKPGTSLKPEDGVILGQMGNMQISRVLSHEVHTTFQPSLL